MNNRSQSMRLFYAFTLTDNVRASVIRAAENLKQALRPGQVRWTHPEDLHITALFLGNFPSNKLELFTDVGKNVAAGFAPFYITVGGYGCFPDRGGVRVAWIGGKEQAEQSASNITKQLRNNLPDIKLDQKPFKPHITLGYVKENANSAEIRNALLNLPQPDCGHILVDHFVLMETLPQENRNQKYLVQITPNTGMKRYNIVQTFPLVL